MESKTRLNLLTSTDLKLNETISEGGYSESEQTSLSISKVTLFVLRSNVYINNFNIERELVDVGQPTIFIYIIYLQDKMMQITNIDFNITGTISNGVDPFNGYFENITISDYALQGGMEFITNWNYPEASLQNELIFNNIKVSSSNERGIKLFPFIIDYGGPGNLTVKNADFKNFYSSDFDITASAVYFGNTECQPNDDNPQLITFDNIATSLLNNEVNQNKINIFGVLIEINLYRKFKIYAKNLNLINHEYSKYEITYYIGDMNSELYISDSKFWNLTSIQANAVTITTQLIVSLQNITFENVTNASQSLFDLIFNSYNVTISNITINSISGTSTSANDIITLHNFPETITVVQGLYVFDSILDGKAIVKSVSELTQIKIIGSTFESIKITSSDYIIDTGLIKSIIFNSITISNIKTTDDTSTNGAVLLISTLDLSSELDTTIQDIAIDDCDIPFIVFSSVINESSSSKTISISNVNFTNTNFDSDRALLSTDSIQIDTRLQISMSDIMFSNISFLTTGTLIECKQQLPTYLTIINSQFTDLTAAKLVVKSLNTQSTNLTTLVQINDTIFNSIDDRFNSFINVNEGGQLEINNWTFTNIVSYQDGAVINAGARQTTTIITESTFMNNTAIQGSVFSIQDESVIKWYSCTFSNNFASVSGIVRVAENGYFEIYSSQIYNNYASQSPISELLDNAVTSVIDNTRIHSNEALTNDEIVNEFNTRWVKLWFVPSEYKQLTLSSSQNYFATTSYALFTLISASISVQNSTSITQQNTLFNLFLSKTSIIDSTISDIDAIETAVRVTSSTLNMTNVNISEIMNPSNYDLILVTIDSTLIMNSLMFHSSKSNLFNSKNAIIQIDGLTILNITSFTNFIKISSSQNVIISQYRTTNATTDINKQILITDSDDVSIVDFEVLKTPELIVEIINSNVTGLSGLRIQNWQEAVYLLNCNIENIQKSNFTNNGNSNQRLGGALYIKDSTAVIQNSTFANNTADDGGAIYFGCSFIQNWNLTLTNLTFIHNNAVKQGGAIYYDNVRPIFTRVVYIDNSAQYGSDIASYPVKIKLVNSSHDDISLFDVGSGIVYNETLSFGLYDFDNQVMVLDNSNQIVISVIDTQTSSVSGTNAGLLRQGIASFQNLIFISTPGSTGILYRATSKAIDVDKIQNVFGQQISENNINVDFRFCRPGEIMTSENQCQKCSAGTYSLEWNSTQCQNCLEDVICNGGANIELAPEYWRRTTNSTRIIQWLNPDACKGGYHPDNANPIKCTDGYRGVLWTQCEVTDDHKYQRTADNVCEKCPDLILNAIRVIGVAIVVFIFFMLLIIINIRKSKESDLSTLMRILTNYLQLLTTSLSFDVQYPRAFTEIFYPVDRIGSSSDTFLSFDWFFTGLEVTGPFPSSTFFKLFLIALLPIILFIIISMIWIIVRIICYKWVPELKRNIAISFISIVFLLHPTLAENSLSIFQCIEIDDGVRKVRIYTEMDWYNNEHLSLCFIIGFPILVFWVTFIPAFALILLAKNIKKDESNKVKQYMLILYQGLKPEKYYWEFFNSLRKVLILMSFSLLITYRPSYGIMIAIVMLLLTFRVQIRLNPYKKNEYNNIEILALLTGSLTILSGLIFTSDENQIAILNMLILIIVIVFNVSFILKWLYLLILCLSEQYKIFQYILIVFDILKWRKNVFKGRYS